MISNVDRSTPEHAVHPTGSVGGGGQRGTDHSGPGSDPDTGPHFFMVSHKSVGKGLKQVNSTQQASATCMYF